MKNRLLFFSLKRIELFLIGCILLFNCSKEEPNIGEKLWYTNPSKDWFSALPLGNGRLGAMVYGTISEEHIQLNEESLWSGTPEETYPKDLAKHYQKFRELNLQRKFTQAKSYGLKHFEVNPSSFRSYTTLGDLFIKTGHKEVKNYKRSLDLETGISTVIYSVDGKRYLRESFVSTKYDAMFFHFKSLDDEKMTSIIRYDRERDISKFINNDKFIQVNGQLEVLADDLDKNPGGSGKNGKHMKFTVHVGFLPTDGDISSKQGQLYISNTSEFTVFVSAVTDYNADIMDYDRSINTLKKSQKIIRRATNTSYAKIKKNHIEYHSNIYNRVDFEIANLKKDTISTDKRIQRLKENTNDLYLTQTFFQYGRYLLMASSGGNSKLPANLQGIWNNKLWARWMSDYHMNINLQMNYWLADVCNLSETFGSLNNFLFRLSEKGKEPAKKLIDSNGWMIPHATNAFGRVSPTGTNTIAMLNNSYCFPLTGSWMSLSLWRHYEFTKDENYLKQTVYPIIKGTTLFILDFVKKNEKGEYITVPSYSPENIYIDPLTEKKVRNTVASTMDIQIIREVFKVCLEIERLLGKKELTKRINKVITKLPSIKIGKDGTIQEWYEDYKEAEPNHRHISHLFGLYPGAQITNNTPKLYKAAEKTIEKRLQFGGGQTGWSKAWIINFYARLYNGNESNKHIIELLRTLTAPNLFDLHPPYTFQIDGNLGVSAGIAEMLLQSHEENVIRLLPALPNDWATGYISGLKARGSFLVDIFWRNGVLENVTITAKKKGKKNILYNGKSITISMKKGDIIKLNINDFK